MTETPDEQPTDLGQEMLRLASAAQDWARRTFADPSEHRGTSEPGGTSECYPWCPICQFANILRGEHPEIGERVAEAGTALAAAIKAVADAAIARAQPGAPDPDDRSRPKPPPRVQRIRLDEPEES
jgi:hypothetical protein